LHKTSRALHIIRIFLNDTDFEMQMLYRSSSSEEYMLVILLTNVKCFSSGVFLDYFLQAPI